ncbi:MAG: NAD+ synthase [Acidimicrobiia bacterium]
MSSNKIKIALGQISLKVGVDEATMSTNSSMMKNIYHDSRTKDCDVILFPELAITGYVPEDLLFRNDVRKRINEFTDEYVEEIKKDIKEQTVIFGTPRSVDINTEGKFDQDLVSSSTLEIGNSALANSAIVVNSEIYMEVYKSKLPNWSVFDEARWFAHAQEVGEIFNVGDSTAGVAICRDIWIESIVKDLTDKGAQIIFVPNASPYANSRHEERIRVCSHYAKKYQVAIAYVNIVGACDETVFDGGSFVIDQQGNVIAQANRFEEELLVVDVEIYQNNKTQPHEKVVEKTDQLPIDLSATIDHEIFDPEETYKAIVLATREFINSISTESKVAIGLSGGVDSALVATIAVDALGSSRVHGVMMPSKFTSQRSLDDAAKLVNKLSITSEVISIENLHDTASKDFSLDDIPSIVGENIQSRLRGMILMMLSNRDHYLVLATSNKSESAVGYCTLYGDTVGAWSPIKDVYKTQVYEICNWRNSVDEYEIENPIPIEIIDRAPTAELKENQTDEQALYPYEILDGVLQRFVDWEMSIEDIVESGFDKQAVERIVSLVKKSEFKRKQTSVGTRLTRRNFGKGRRIPISAHW